MHDAFLSQRAEERVTLTSNPKDGDGPGGPLPVDENGGARVAR